MKAQKKDFGERKSYEKEKRNNNIAKNCTLFQALLRVASVGFGLFGADSVVVGVLRIVSHKTTACFRLIKK